MKKRGWGRALRRSSRLLSRRQQIRAYMRDYFEQEQRLGRLVRQPVHDDARCILQAPHPPPCTTSRRQP